MNILSKALRNISDYDFEANEGQWKNRQRQWKKEWEIKKSDRGFYLPTPADVVEYPLWQVENGDVGDWRSAAHKDTDGSRNPSTVIADEHADKREAPYQKMDY